MWGGGEEGGGQRVLSTHPEICSIDQATHPPSIYSQYTIFHMGPEIIYWAVTHIREM